MTEIRKSHLTANVFKWGLFILASAAAMFGIGWLNGTIQYNRQRLSEDRAELAKWRDARDQCVYMRAVGDMETLEAACYRESFHKGESLAKAVDQCHATINQCDTVNALTE